MVLITQVLPYRRTKLFEVCSENGVEFLATEAFLTEQGLKPLASFNEETFDRIRAQAQVLDGIRKCVDILSRKDYSRKELTAKLTDKGIPQDAAIAAVGYMTDHGYQDDFRYGKRLAELNKQIYGKKRIEQMLYHHGLDRETISEILEEVFADGDETERILDRITEKAAAKRDLNDPPQRNKVFAKLARLGYGPSEISAALSRYEEMRNETN